MEYKSKKHKYILEAGLLIYLVLLFYLVFLCKAFGRDNAEIIRYQSVNWQPFNTIKHYIRIIPYVDINIILTNLLGNIVVFIPLGYLLPSLSMFFRNWLKIIIVSCILSMVIEVTQGYLQIGVLDVDDVILNVLGGLSGYIIFILLKHISIRRQSLAQNRRETNDYNNNNESSIR